MKQFPENNGKFRHYPCGFAFDRGTAKRRPGKDFNGPGLNK
jgi:hypothetical protein